MIGNFGAGSLKAELNLPDNLAPLLVVAVGEPAETGILQYNDKRGRIHPPVRQFQPGKRFAPSGSGCGGAGGDGEAGGSWAGGEYEVLASRIILHNFLRAWGYVFSFTSAKGCGGGERRDVRYGADHRDRETGF